MENLKKTRSMNIKGKSSNRNKRVLRNRVILSLLLILIVILIISFCKTNLKLNGERNVKVAVNTEYIESGAKATKIFKNLSDDIKIEGNVDTSKCGIYDINYVLYSKDGKEIKRVARKVEVYDDIVPELKLKGEKNITVYQNREYDDPGYSAIDNYDGDITDKVSVEGKVDVGNLGEYTLNYVVKDSSGNETTVKRIVKVVKLEKTLENGLPVLMYHFFYDETKGTDGVDGNFTEVKAFEEQMKYLSENNFYFPSWKEVERYIDGKEDLPEKSVVITVDDGSYTFFDLAVPIIQKYNTKATSFVITSWKGEEELNDYQKLNNIILESHSHDMHRAGIDGKGRIMTLSNEEIIEDVKESSRLLGGATVFCYPFGHYNERAEKALNDGGYTLAFTTRGGRVYPGMNKMELPRVRMSRGDSLNAFIKKVS